MNKALYLTIFFSSNLILCMQTQVVPAAQAMSSSASDRSSSCSRISDVENGQVETYPENKINTTCKTDCSECCFGWMEHFTDCAVGPNGCLCPDCCCKYCCPCFWDTENSLFCACDMAGRTSSRIIGLALTSLGVSVYALIRITNKQD